MPDRQFWFIHSFTVYFSPLMGEQPIFTVDIGFSSSSSTVYIISVVAANLALISVPAYSELYTCEVNNQYHVDNVNMSNDNILIPWFSIMK